MNPQLTGERAEALAGRPRDRLGEPGLGSSRAPPAEDLGQDHQPRPLLRRAANQRLGAIEIRALVRAGSHLNGGGGEHGLNNNRSPAARQAARRVTP
jgi:hypothetical protein